MQARTLLEAINYFSDELKCIEFLRDQRWPDGNVICPRCGKEKATWIASRNVWQCRSAHPQRTFSIKVGTIFEDSPIPLAKWLPAMWLLSSAKNGISSYELSKALGVQQKSAWFMLCRIRLAMQDPNADQFLEDVEADESFIGGKARFMHKDKRAEKITGTGGSGKVAVMGLLERHGPDGHSRVRTTIVANRRRAVLSGQVRKNVTPGSRVYTDALPSYSDLSADFVHGFIDHAEKYVDGQIHTNGIENYWALLKRCLHGTYISVQPFHLFRYLDEEAFRFNTRKMLDADRMERLTKAVAGKRLTYKELIGLRDAT